MWDGFGRVQGSGFGFLKALSKFRVVECQV